MERLGVAHKLIKRHLISGSLALGSEIGIQIDQTLTQDATGSMVMLELEAMNCQRSKAKVSAQYIDHNLLQTDFRTADEHLFLRTACQRFGIHLSPPGNGICHPLHMELFGKPGETLLGSDSHTCAAGALGMLAIGAGGLEVALAIMGKPYFMQMPPIFGVHLKGKLPPWVSAKDIILEMLKRHGMSGAAGKIIEYYGAGLKGLSVMDRHVIANMGAELGATSTVFPSDKAAYQFLKSYGRAKDFIPLKADLLAKYDQHDEIDLSLLDPLIALPYSPCNVEAVEEVIGREVSQCVVGSSANPGLRDFMIVAKILKGQHIAPHVSLDINPSTRQVLESLSRSGCLTHLIRAGARIHQSGCSGSIGMGQAPASNTISLRTFPRNFMGHSGTADDQVYLCSPETAAASALKGVITDPRQLTIKYPKLSLPQKFTIHKNSTIAPINTHKKSQLIMGPHIKPLPKLEPIQELVQGNVLLKVADDISTDEILPVTSQELPLRSHISEIAKFTFSKLDPTFYERSLKRHKEGFFILAKENYGQGSSKEHAALAPRFLGLKCVIALSYAHIYRKNLINFGVLPLLFSKVQDYEMIDVNDELEIYNLYERLGGNSQIEVRNITQGKHFTTLLQITDQEALLLKAGGLINFVLKKARKLPSKELKQPSLPLQTLPLS